MTDIAKIAEGLTEATCEALLSCHPWDVEAGAGPAVQMMQNRLVRESTILDDAVELTTLGLALRAYLEAKEPRP